MPPRLSPEQVERYRRDGYLFPIRLFADEELDPLRRHVEQLIASLPPGGRPEGLNMLHPDDPFLLDWLVQPRILDLVEPIVGPDIVLFASHFISKPAAKGQAVPWHQDSVYWPLSPMKVVTIWLAVDPATVANGCMRVIPGSHTWGDIGHRELADKQDYVLPLESDRSRFDERDAVDLELQPGEVSLHDAFLLHGSNPNTSAMRRCGFTMRYMPAGVKLDRAKSPDHPLYLVRGEDREGTNTYAGVPARRAAEAAG